MDSELRAVCAGCLKTLKQIGQLNNALTCYARESGIDKATLEQVATEVGLSGCQDENAEQCEIQFRLSYDALMARMERDKLADALEAATSHEELPNNVISLAERSASARIDAAFQMADMLIELHGGEINRPETFDDSEVPRQMIEEAAERWSVTVKEVEMYVWDLHDRGAPYQYIREYLLDIED